MRVNNAKLYYAYDGSLQGTVGHKSLDTCFHKKYIEEGFITFVAHCTW